VPVPSYVIETNNLTKEYGDLLAVDGLDLQIEKGEIFGFLGPNGAGKTTAIRMMVGLLEPTSGGVKIEVKDGEEGESVAVCPQKLVLWEELTPYENIHFMGKMHDVPRGSLDSRVDQILIDLDLDEKRDNLASELSGGMQRRLNLGMSLVQDPSILVLDEPSAGLDPQSRYSLWEYIRSLKEEEGKTIILTTHLMEEADRLSDRVGIMDRGKLLTVDRPKQLKKSVGEGDSIRIELTDPGQSEAALRVVSSLEGVLETKDVDQGINLRALDAVGQVTKFTRALEDKGFEISDVAISRTNTLEDVFIHLTGREFRP